MREDPPFIHEETKEARRLARTTPASLEQALDIVEKCRGLANTEDRHRAMEQLAREAAKS